MESGCVEMSLILVILSFPKVNMKTEGRSEQSNSRESRKHLEMKRRCAITLGI